MKKILFLAAILLFVSTSCKQEEPCSQEQNYRAVKPNASYQLGRYRVLSELSDENLAISFEIEYGQVEDISFQCTWIFQDMTHPERVRALHLTEQDFLWKTEKRKLIGTSREVVNIPNHYSHKVEPFRYHLLINGRWWHYQG